MKVIGTIDKFWLVDKTIKGKKVPYVKYHFNGDDKSEYWGEVSMDTLKTYFKKCETTSTKIVEEKRKVEILVKSRFYREKEYFDGKYISLFDKNGEVIYNGEVKKLDF